jgi:outer membrane receptor protein involved in Fe transport
MTTRTIRPSIALACAWALAVSMPALSAADAPNAVADAPAVELPPYEVVDSPLANVPEADRFATTLKTISAAQLEELKALDFASALRRTPGVTISRFNQVGAFGGGEGGAVFVRGLGSSRPGGEIKTLIDGVPKMNGIFNHPLLDLMAVDAAASIDVHARATPLEIGNTFAAINITTPRVAEEGRVARVSLAAGSYGTFVERVDLGLREGSLDAYVSQSLRVSDGHRPDSDGHMENYLVRLGWTPSSAWGVSYMLNHTDNRATDPGAEGASASTRGDRYETTDWFHVATLTHDTGPLSGTVRAYLHDGDGNWIRRQFSGNADSLNSWRLCGVRWRETAQPWEGGAVLAGVDLDYSRGTTRSRPIAPAAESAFGPMTTRILSAYAGVSHEAELSGTIKVTPSAGARFYDHSVFESQWAPQAGVTVSSGHTQLHAGYSRAVNYPGLEVAVFSQMFIPALGQSWRSLNAELADQFEVGLRHAFSDSSAVAVTAFQNRVRDRYVIVFPPPPPPRYSNLETYRTEGVEFTGDAKLGDGIGVFAAVALMRATPDDVPYAPKCTVTTGLNWRIAHGWFLSADSVYVSSMHQASVARVAGTPNPSTVGAQFLLNARLSRRFPLGAGGAMRGEVYLSGENLTDRDFAYQPGYPIPGINFMLGVRLER